LTGVFAFIGFAATRFCSFAAAVALAGLAFRTIFGADLAARTGFRAAGFVAFFEDRAAATALVGLAGFVAFALDFAGAARRFADGRALGERAG
jgi:hypothetical protein